MLLSVEKPLRFSQLFIIYASVLILPATSEVMVTISILLTLQPSKSSFSSLIGQNTYIVIFGFNVFMVIEREEEDFLHRLTRIFFKYGGSLFWLEKLKKLSLTI